MQIVFSPAARGDLVRLREFIRGHNPDAARRMTERILEMIEYLPRFPQMGKPLYGRENYRDFAFVFGARGYGRVIK